MTFRSLASFSAVALEERIELEERSIVTPVEERRLVRSKVADDAGLEGAFVSVGGEVLHPTMRSEERKTMERGILGSFMFEGEITIQL